MADVALLAAAASAILVLLVMWGLLAHGAMARRQAEGHPVLAVTTLVLYGIAPLLFWAAGAHHPVSDYAKLPLLTGPERAVGRASLSLMIALLGSAALYFLSRREGFDRRGRAVWLSFLGFTAGPILAMAFATRPGLRYPMLLAPGAMTVVYLSMRGGPERWTRLARRLLLLYVWGSAAAALVKPEWAFEAQSRATLLIGTRPRLVGITATPNALGPAAATALIIVIATSRGRWRLVNGIAAGTALILTDSRMAMLGAVIGLVIMYIQERPNGRGLRMVLGSSLVALPLLLALGTDSPLETIAAASGGRLPAQQVSTLNGRVDLWRATMDEWRRNPAFGYGPALWSPDHRYQYGQRFNWAGQAHNQLVQTLGDSGLVGLTGLVAHLAVMIRAALVTSVRSGGLTGALVALLIVRMTSESALRSPDLDVTTLLHVLTVTVLIAFSAPVKRRPAARGAVGVWTSDITDLAVTEGVPGRTAEPNARYGRPAVTR